MPYGLHFYDVEGRTLLWVKVLYCKLQPLQCNCLVMEPCGPLEDLSEVESEVTEQQWLDDFEHNFTYTLGMAQLRGWQELPSVPRRQVDVIRGLVFRRGMKLCSDQPIVGLEEVLAGRIWQKTDPEEEEKRARSKGSVEEDIKAQYPGFTEYFQNKQGRSASSSGGAEAEEVVKE
eukprot:843334-Lingulodinium_polyedra.AAC.1